MAAVKKKVGQKSGEVGLLVEYLFCAYGDQNKPLVAHIPIGGGQMLINYSLFIGYSLC